MNSHSHIRSATAFLRVEAVERGGHAGAVLGGGAAVHHGIANLYRLLPGEWVTMLAEGDGEPRARRCQRLCGATRPDS
jgi:hypothetical protein